MERLFSALPTPFLGENCIEIDYKSLEKLIDFQVKNDVEGLVFSGSTGEGHTLTKNEWCELITFGIKKVREYNKKYSKKIFKRLYRHRQKTDVKTAFAI